MLGFRFFINNKMNYSHEFDSLEGFFAHAENSACEIMQSIGIKDSRGKEIFEGDIVVIDSGICSYTEIVKDLISFFEKCKNIKNSALIIIGNVYENPELLEEFNVGI